LTLAQARRPSRERQARDASAEATDADLLHAIAKDDLGALGALYDRHAAYLWRVVRRVSNGSADIDDVVHATFLKVPSLASKYDGRPSARGWLAGIAVRLALRQSRTLGRFAGMLKRFAHFTPDADRVDPEALAGGRAELAVLERAVAALSPAKRAVFVLVEVEGFSHDDVAGQLGVPTATVRTRLFHAKRELRDALARADGGRT
jgi:RNA polymerase sigma-70 factor (ECF subfamily)